MKKRRGLGAVSHFVAYQQGLIELLDSTNATSSVISAAFEQRLDDVEDSQTTLADSLTDEIARATAAEAALSASHDGLSASYASLSASYAALSRSYTVFSASAGAGGNLNVSMDAELIFDGDTLMTDADVYISGSGNNLYLHGTNYQGMPAKFEFSIVSGSTFIQEVAHGNFGDSVDDPWFKFDGETLLTHADIYVSGSGNYLYLNGTNESGSYAKYYFDIVSGSVIIKESGSV
jgi:hypothetical protein